MWNTLRVRMALLTLSSLSIVLVSSVLVWRISNDPNSVRLPREVVVGVSVLAPIAALVLAFSFFSLAQLIRPLRRLTEMTEKIANGDLSAAQQTVGGVREIEQLRRTLDHMAQQVLAGQNALLCFNDRLDRARDKQREDVGLELHDNFLQSLTVLNQQLERVQEQLQPRHPVSALLSSSRQLLSDVTAELRQYASHLHPPVLEGMSLLPALKGLASKSKATFQVSGEERELATDRGRELYYFIKEALHNAAKHADARQVQVVVAYDAAELLVTVKDDGIGFDVPADFGICVQADHLGLMGMQQRARRLDGHFQIHSEPQCGTEIILRLPFETEQR